MNQNLEHTESASVLPGWEHFYSGKVRDLFRYIDDPNFMLIVATDRVSAFDHVLEPEIPGKGILLTTLSNWWFDQLSYPNHLAIEGPECPQEVAGRAMVSRALKMLPVECVVRGAITGSGLLEYNKSGTVCGIELPAGLSDGDLLHEPIYTPAYKAPLGEHDENITFEQTVELVGSETATKLRDMSLAIFEEASKIAAERGLILADTKFEFGIDPETGQIVLADEVLTSDSSRYWDASVYETESGSARLASFDKQIIRDWLRNNWNNEGDPPPLPQEIVDQTRDRYRELLEKFAGPNTL